MKNFLIISASIILAFLLSYIDNYKEIIICGLSAFFGVFVTSAATLIAFEVNRKSKEEDYYR